MIVSWWDAIHVLFRLSGDPSVQTNQPGAENNNEK
jgi:hypothetical protein